MGLVVDKMALRFFSEYVSVPVSCCQVFILIFHSYTVSAM